MKKYLHIKGDNNCRNDKVPRSANEILRNLTMPQWPVHSEKQSGVVITIHRIVKRWLTFSQNV